VACLEDRNRAKFPKRQPLAREHRPKSQPNPGFLRTPAAGLQILGMMQSGL
jgi:hypothetical protein